VVGWQLAGRCAPRWSWTRWRWRCTSAAPAPTSRWSTTAIAAASTPRSTTPRRSRITGCSPRGSVGDAYDNALAESFVDSFNTELIADRVWRSRSQLELAVVEWIGWFNTARLHSALGDRPPLEFEQTELSGHTDRGLAGFAGSSPQMRKLETT
jgi:putative transposase